MCFDQYRICASVIPFRRLMASHNLNPFELGAVANLCPENAEEARTLVPSLFQVST